MKNFVAVVLAALMSVYSMPMNAAVPVCQLGGPTAMDPNRQLAEGERFVLTDRPLVVNLRFRATKEHPEQVGECMLPSRSEVAIDKNGILQWARACGNNEVNKNVFVTPFNLQGIPGPVGPMGPQGPAGRDGRDGLQGLPGRDYEPLPSQGLVVKKKKHTWLYVAGGILLAGGIVALASGGGKKDKKLGDGNTIP